MDRDSDDDLSILEIKQKMVEKVLRKAKITSSQAAADLLDSDYEPSDRSEDSDDSDEAPLCQHGTEQRNENVGDGDSSSSIPPGVPLAPPSVALTAKTVEEPPAEGLSMEQGETSTARVKEPTRSRKRQRNPDQWKRNIRKKARQSGQEYTRQGAPKRGSVAPAKTSAVLRQLCPGRCRYQCNTITDETRQLIFDYFYSIDQEAKDAYLFGCIRSHEPNRKLAGARRHHNLSYQFKVKVGEVQRRLCKMALCTLLGISRKVIDRIKKSVEAGKAGPAPSHQGCHNNRPNKVPEEMHDYVISHIASFPAESSHYSRYQNPNRKYLSPSLSIAKMYALYQEKCAQENKKVVSEHYYNDVFVQEFNLGFGNPRTDVCAKCDVGQGGEEHQAAARRAKDEMKSDRERAKEVGGPAYITFDLQKTLPLPKIPTSVAFYLRQLWFYNLGVHLVTPHGENGFMQTWLESEAGRGANEICSGLLAFFEAAQDHLGSRHLVAWSDSCGGQNKNFTVVTFWQYLLSTKKFVLIDHKFPEVGHSYMDSDRDFGIIELALSKVERVHAPEEYRSLIKGSKTKSKNKFVVQNIANGLINANNLKKEMKLVKKQRTTTKEKVEFRGIRWLRFEKLGFYKYRMSFDEKEAWKEVDIRGRNFKPEFALDLSSPELALHPGRPIHAAKYADLKKQLPYIPRIHHSFYNSILSVDNPGSTDSSTNNSENEDGSDME